MLQHNNTGKNVITMDAVDDTDGSDTDDSVFGTASPSSSRLRRQQQQQNLVGAAAAAADAADGFSTKKAALSSTAFAVLVIIGLILPVRSPDEEISVIVALSEKVSLATSTRSVFISRVSPEMKIGNPPKPILNPVLKNQHPQLCHKLI